MELSVRGPDAVSITHMGNTSAGNSKLETESMSTANMDLNARYENRSLGERLSQPLAMNARIEDHMSL
jgi:hypothetical protein